MGSKIYDVIVLGLGAMGSAALYQLSKNEGNFLGLDQFAPPHQFGSTHGDSRITRTAIGEGDYYTPIALRSHQIWREIESQIGELLLYQVGGVCLSYSGLDAICHGKGFVRQTIDSAVKYNIKHEQLSTEQLKRRFPQFKYYGNEIGYYEPDAGYLLPEKCVEAQLKLARTHGAEIRINEKVINYKKQQDLLKIQTDKSEYLCKKLVLTAGSWINDFMTFNYQDYFKIYRQVLYWFETDLDISNFMPEKCPIYISVDQEEPDCYYGFPAVNGINGGIKIASEQYEITTKPDQVNRNVSEAEKQKTFDHLSKYIKIKNKCLKAVTCIYTTTPDYMFVIDQHPDNQNVIIASPCSGHGFKHSAGIGQILSDLSLERKTDFDISMFRLGRFK